MTKLAEDFFARATTDPNLWDNYPKIAWEDDSFAVVANWNGNGVVLWTGGPHVAFEIEQGSRQLNDLGLDDAPNGINVWVGKYLWHPGGYEDANDGESAPHGTFREPTPEEWKAIQTGKNPWDDADWRKIDIEEKTP